MIPAIPLKPSSIAHSNRTFSEKISPLTQRVAQAVCHFFTRISDLFSNWITTTYKSLKDYLIAKQEPLNDAPEIFYDALDYFYDSNNNTLNPNVSSKEKPILNANVDEVKGADTKTKSATSRDQFIAFLNKNLKSKPLINVLQEKIIPSNIESFELEEDGSSFKLIFDKEYKAENVQVPKGGLTKLDGANFSIRPTVEGTISTNNSIQTIKLTSNHLIVNLKIGFLQLTTSLTSVEIDNDLDARNEKCIIIQTGNRMLDKALQQNHLSSMKLQETFKNLKWT